MHRRVWRIKRIQAWNRPWMRLFSRHWWDLLQWTIQRIIRSINGWRTRQISTWNQYPSLFASSIKHNQALIRLQLWWIRAIRLADIWQLSVWLSIGFISTIIITSIRIEALAMLMRATERLFSWRIRFTYRRENRWAFVSPMMRTPSAAWN